MPDDLAIRLAQHRLVEHQASVAAMQRVLTMARTTREKKYAQASIDYSVKQIDRLVAWLAAQEAA